MKSVTAGLAAKSSGVTAAADRAAAILDGKLRLEAYALTFIDAFHLVAWACVLTLMLIALLRRFPLTLRDLAFPQQSVNETRKD